MSNKERDFLREIGLLDSPEDVGKPDTEGVPDVGKPDISDSKSEREFLSSVGLLPEDEKERQPEPGSLFGRVAETLRRPMDRIRDVLRGEKEPIEDEEVYEKVPPGTPLPGKVEFPGDVELEPDITPKEDDPTLAKRVEGLAKKTAILPLIPAKEIYKRWVEGKEKTFLDNYEALIRSGLPEEIRNETLFDYEIKVVDEAVPEGRFVFRDRYPDERPALATLIPPVALATLDIGREIDHATDGFYSNFYELSTGRKAAFEVPHPDDPDKKIVGEVPFRRLIEEGMLAASSDIGLPPSMTAAFILATDFAPEDAQELAFRAGVILAMKVALGGIVKEVGDFASAAKTAKAEQFSLEVKSKWPDFYGELNSQVKFLKRNADKFQESPHKFYAAWKRIMEKMSAKAHDKGLEDLSKELAAKAQNPTANIPHAGKIPANVARQINIVQDPAKKLWYSTEQDPVRGYVKTKVRLDRNPLVDMVKDSSKKVGKKVEQIAAGKEPDLGPWSRKAERLANKVEKKFSAGKITKAEARRELVEIAAKWQQKLTNELPLPHEKLGVTGVPPEEFYVLGKKFQPVIEQIQQGKSSSSVGYDSFIKEVARSIARKSGKKSVLDATKAAASLEDIKLKQAQQLLNHIKKTFPKLTQEDLTTLAVSLTVPHEQTKELLETQAKMIEDGTFEDLREAWVVREKARQEATKYARSREARQTTDEKGPEEVDKEEETKRIFRVEGVDEEGAEVEWEGFAETAELAQEKAINARGLTDVSSVNVAVQTEDLVKVENTIIGSMDSLRDNEFRLFQKLDPTGGRELRYEIALPLMRGDIDLGQAQRRLRRSINQVNDYFFNFEQGNAGFLRDETLNIDHPGTYTPTGVKRKKVTKDMRKSLRGRYESAMARVSLDYRDVSRLAQFLGENLQAGGKDFNHFNLRTGKGVPLNQHRQAIHAIEESSFSVENWERAMAFLEGEVASAYTEVVRDKAAENLGRILAEKRERVGDEFGRFLDDVEKKEVEQAESTLDEMARQVEDRTKLLYPAEQARALAEMLKRKPNKELKLINAVVRTGRVRITTVHPDHVMRYIPKDEEKLMSVYFTDDSTAPMLQDIVDKTYNTTTTELKAIEEFFKARRKVQEYHMARMAFSLGKKLAKNDKTKNIRVDLEEAVHIHGISAAEAVEKNQGNILEASDIEVAAAYKDYISVSADNLKRIRDIGREFPNISFTGHQTGGSSEEIAALFQVYRKNIESVHAIYILPDGTIGGHDLISTGSGRSVALRESHYESMSEKATKLNAQEVVLLHNHPTGRVSPSAADTKSFKFINDKDQRFTKSIIINEGVFSVIKRGGVDYMDNLPLRDLENSILDAKNNVLVEYGEFTVSSESRIPLHGLLGTDDNLVNLIKNDEIFKENKAILFWINTTTNRLRGAEPIDIEQLGEPEVRDLLYSRQELDPESDLKIVLPKDFHYSMGESEEMQALKKFKSFMVQSIPEELYLAAEGETNPPYWLSDILVVDPEANEYYTIQGHPEYKGTSEIVMSYNFRNYLRTEIGKLNIKKGHNDFFMEFQEKGDIRTIDQIKESTQEYDVEWGAIPADAPVRQVNMDGIFDPDEDQVIQDQEFNEKLNNKIKFGYSDVSAGFLEKGVGGISKRLRGVLSHFFNFSEMEQIDPQFHRVMRDVFNMLGARYDLMKAIMFEIGETPKIKGMSQEEVSGLAIVAAQDPRYAVPRELEDLVLKTRYVLNTFKNWQLEKGVFKNPYPENQIEQIDTMIEELSTQLKALTQKKAKEIRREKISFLEEYRRDLQQLKYMTHLPVVRAVMESKTDKLLRMKNIEKVKAFRKKQRTFRTNMTSKYRQRVGELAPLKRRMAEYDKLNTSLNRALSQGFSQEANAIQREIDRLKSTPVEVPTLGWWLQQEYNGQPILTYEDIQWEEVLMEYGGRAIYKLGFRHLINYLRERKLIISESEMSSEDRYANKTLNDNKWQQLASITNNSPYRVGEVKGLYVHEYAKKFLDELFYELHPSRSGYLGGLVDKVATLYKMGQFLSPWIIAWYNWQQHLAAGLSQDPRYYRNFPGALRTLLNWGSDNKVWDRALRVSIKRGVFSKPPVAEHIELTDAKKNVIRSLKNDKGVISRTNKLVNRYLHFDLAPKDFVTTIAWIHYIQANLTFGTVDPVMRLTAFKTALDQGFSEDTAAEMVTNFSGAYGNISSKFRKWGHKLLWVFMLKPLMIRQGSRVLVDVLDGVLGSATGGAFGFGKRWQNVPPDIRKRRIWHLIMIAMNLFGVHNHQIVRFLFRDEDKWEIDTEVYGYSYEVRSKKFPGVSLTVRTLTPWNHPLRWALWMKRPQVVMKGRWRRKIESLLRNEVNPFYPALFDILNNAKHGTGSAIMTHSAPPTASAEKKREAATKNFLQAFRWLLTNQTKIVQELTPAYYLDMSPSRYELQDQTIKRALNKFEEIMIALQGYSFITPDYAGMAQSMYSAAYNEVNREILRQRDKLYDARKPEESVRNFNELSQNLWNLMGVYHEQIYDWTKGVVQKPMIGDPPRVDNVEQLRSDRRLRDLMDSYKQINPLYPWEEEEGIKTREEREVKREQIRRMLEKEGF